MHFAFFFQQNEVARLPQEAIELLRASGGLQSLESECRSCREKFMAELPKHLVVQRPLWMRWLLNEGFSVLQCDADVVALLQPEKKSRSAS